MKTTEEINEEFIRKLAREYFKESIKTELDSAIIFTYIKSLEDRINKAIKRCEELKEAMWESEGAYTEMFDELNEILKGEDNESN